ncbi:hypothetical protein ACFL26_00775 [Patescibacteria group bacterium]
MAYVLDAAEIERRFPETRGALKDLATSNDEAVRRHSREADEDGWLYDFVRPYLLDTLKIIGDKSVRGATQKTQVITHPLNSHARNRLVHSFDVCNVGVPCAAWLALNEELCLAQELAHDLGHGPGGHGFEDFILAHAGIPFRHDIFGVVRLQHIARKGHGLGLTKQTLYGVQRHSRGRGDLTTEQMRPEECCTMYGDKIGYVFGDYNDLFARRALKAQGIVPEAFPEVVKATEWFGDCQRDRVRKCIEALCVESADKGYVSFAESETAVKFLALKKLMYTVYETIDRERLNLVFKRVYHQIEKHIKDVDPWVVFALMNDDEMEWINDKIRFHEVITEQTFLALSLGDIIPHIRGKKIDVTDPDLDW